MSSYVKYMIRNCTCMVFSYWKIFSVVRFGHVDGTQARPIGCSSHFGYAVGYSFSSCGQHTIHIPLCSGLCCFRKWRDFCMWLLSTSSCKISALRFALLWFASVDSGLPKTDQTCKKFFWVWTLSPLSTRLNNIVNIRRHNCQAI